MRREINLKFFLCRHKILCLMATVLWFVCFEQPAWAHKVTIFAWVEGDMVHTQSKFSGGKKAQDSTVLIYDLEGNQLLEGKTDENGEFSFKAPKKTDLKIVLTASMGHLGEWILPKEEFTGEEPVSATVAEQPGDSVQESTDGEEGKTPGDAPDLSKPPDQASVQSVAAPAVGLNREEVRQVVEEVLNKKLAPITNMLADLQEQGPTLEKVIGGVGYIFGIVGVAFYFSARSRKK